MDGQDALSHGMEGIRQTGNPTWRRAIDGVGMKGLTDLFGLGRGNGRERRARLRLDMEHTAVYAVGDVHGCLDMLLDLEQAIMADAASLPGGKLIVMLGDYVDRGPASAQVIDHLLAPAPARFRADLPRRQPRGADARLSRKTHRARRMDDDGRSPTLALLRHRPRAAGQVYGSARQSTT